MILGKYKNKRKLGSGGFGMVYLVQDHQGREYAMKVIPLDQLKEAPILLQYLEGEIQCMKVMDSPYLIKLHQTFQDKQFIFMLLDYCQGGDLSYYQCNFLDRVFPMEKAIDVLVDVSKGLEYLHGQGYMHRDIKSQNILITKQDGKEVFKLADFGFSKPEKEAKGTNLGTDQFKAPEIFLEKKYSFEVDMWAFGVLFFTMINKEFPFKLPFIGSQEKKGVYLTKLADQFSYKRAVCNTKLKKEENCTPQMEDLFSRIFQIDQAKRLTFIELREHSIFKKHFPKIDEASKVAYSKRIDLFKLSSQAKQSFINQEVENAPVQMSRFHARTEQLKEQKQLLGRKKDQIDFLADTIYLVESAGDLFESHEVLMLNYNLLKYYVILLRKFKKDLSVEALNKKYPNKRWKEYSLDPQFKEMEQEVTEDTSHNQIKFFGLYDECENYLPTIKEINKHFQKAFFPEIKEDAFEGEFKSSYRASTSYMYSAIRKALKTGKKGNKLHYLLALLVISHAFNNLFHEMEHLQIIFRPYLEERKAKAHDIDYSDLKAWLSSGTPDTLIKVAVAVIKLYLQ